MEALVLRKKDYEKICAILEAFRTEVAELLEEELERAEIVPDDELPPDVVSMNSEVRFIDTTSNHEFTVTLVYPDEADAGESKVSILAPVGAALIGLKVGQSIDWPLPSGKLKRIKVIEVLR